MATDRLTQIRSAAANDAEIAGRATPGPWRTDGTGEVYGPDGANVCVVEERPEDDEFIAHARTAVPRLVAAVKELAAEVERLKADRPTSTFNDPRCCRPPEVIGSPGTVWTCEHGVRWEVAGSDLRAWIRKGRMEGKSPPV